MGWVICRSEKCIGSTLLEHHLCLSGNLSPYCATTSEKFGTSGLNVLWEAILPAPVFRPGHNLPLVGYTGGFRCRPLLAVTGVTLVLIFLITLREKRGTTIIVLVVFDIRSSE